MTCNTQHFELHLTVATDNINPVDLLSTNSHLTKTQVKQVMDKGAVWLTQQQHTRRLRRVKKNLHIDDQLHMYYDQPILSTLPSPATLIADHQTYSIWHKPYGVYCQGSKWGDHCTINRLVEQQTDRPAFVIHRLDRATTGLIIIAHRKRSAAALAKLFEQRQVEKRYLAVVHGEYPASSITIDSPIEGRTAISHIKILDFNPKREQSLLEIHIETGRKHQIRRHLSESGYPIVGDRLYGTASTELESENLRLCCYSLSFICPLSNEQINIQLDNSLQPRLF